MRWFTSDHHFGHARIIELCDRPFADVTEMNEVMIERWNTRVRADDTVYVLGDFALGRISETLPIASRLNGRKILIPGNHDRCWAGEKRAVRRRNWEGRYRAAGFHNVWHLDRPMVTILADGTPVLMWHLPYENDLRGRIELDPLVPRDNGTWLLHGHVHNEWALRGGMSNRPRGRQLNVGVDTAEVFTRGYGFEPISEEEVIYAINHFVVA